MWAWHPVMLQYGSNSLAKRSTYVVPPLDSDCICACSKIKINQCSKIVHQIHYNETLLVALCYVGLAPPPRHQHPRCCHWLEGVAFAKKNLALPAARDSDVNRGTNRLQVLVEWRMEWWLQVWCELEWWLIDLEMDVRVSWQTLSDFQLWPMQITYVPFIRFCPYSKCNLYRLISFARFTTLITLYQLLQYWSKSVSYLLIHLIF